MAAAEGAHQRRLAADEGGTARGGLRASLDSVHELFQSPRLSHVDFHAAGGHEAEAVLRVHCQASLCTQIQCACLAPLVLGVFGASTRSALGVLDAAVAVANAAVILYGTLTKRRAFLPAQGRPDSDITLTRLVALDWSALLLLTVVCCAHAVLGTDAAGTPPTEAALAYFASAHLTVATRWALLQLPARLVLLPELLRACVCVPTLLWCVHQRGETRLRALAVRISIQAVACAVALPIAHGLCHSTRDAARLAAQLPHALRSTGHACGVLSHAVAAAVHHLRVVLAPDVRIEPTTLLTLQLGVAALQPCLGLRLGAMQLARAYNALAAAAVVVGSLHRLRTPHLSALERRLGVVAAGTGTMSRASVAHARLATQLAQAVSEHDVLRVASEALHDLFPAASAQALATLSAEGNGAVATLDVAALDDDERVALQAALPRALPWSQPRDGAGDDGTADGGPTDTSVAFVCGGAGAPPGRGVVIADSADWPACLAQFSDWSAVARVCATAQLVTASLVSRDSGVVGFLVLNFSTLGGFATGRYAERDSSRLRAFAALVGDAIVARRTRDAAESVARTAASMTSIAHDVYPPHLVAAVESRLRRRSSAFSPERVGAGGSNDGDSVSSSARESADLPRIDGAAYAGNGLMASEPFGRRSATDLLMDNYAEVTILFSDVVGWTSLSATMTPAESMAVLDRLWQRFDTLVAAHGVYKVETIGDSYLAVSGMIPARADHGAAALRLALDMHAAAASVDVGDGRCLHVRVGLHTGPITTGVVGHLRARFCVFGDAVNTASRMESSGRADCVQLSAAAYAASGLPAGTLPAREVLIKGKGLMAVHLIDTTTPEAAYVRGLLDVGGMRTPRTSSTMPRLDVPLDRPRERTSVRQAASNDAGGTSEQLTAPSLDDASGTDPNNPETQQSSSGKSSRALAAAAAESAKAASRLREAHAMHFVVQTAIAMSPSIFYIVFGFSRRTRFVLPSNALLAACISGVMLFAIRSALPPAVRDALLPRWPLIFVALHTMLVSCITLVLIGDYIAAERDRLPPVVAVRRYFWAIQLALTSLNWLIAQLPVRVAFFPEIVRSFTYVFAALSVARDEAALTPSFAFAVLVEGAACIVFVCFAVELCFRPSQTVLRQLDSLDTCPAALSGVRDFMQHATRTARARLFDDAVLLDATAVVFLGFYSGLMAFHIFIVKPGMPLPAAASSLAQVMTLLLIAAAAAKLRPTSEASLDALAAQHHLATHGHTFTLLRERLAAADSEASILRAACDAIADLFPGAAACALGAFAEGTAQDVVCSLECVGDERSRRALADSLPAGVGTADAGSSVALACRGGPGRVPAVVDSRNQAGGVEVYTDWRAAIAGGLPSTQAITAPLNAGQVVIGFVQLHFNVYAAANRQDTNAERAVLRELSGVVGGAVFVRRALAINRDAFASGMRAAGVPLAPRARQSTTTVTAAAAAAKSRRAFPASEEDARVLALLDERRDADRELLRDWALDAWQLPDGEVARLIAAMLHSGGLLRRFRISPAALSAFIDDVLQKYPNNPFHCGRHAFSVMHTSFLFLQDGVLRKELLEPIDSLALLLAALCHDLEHPGTTNAFQINSGSELAMRYNDSSVLEHHHCAMAFATMERHALLSGLDRSEYVVLRKSIVAAILATDMAQHKDLLARVSARVMRRESEAEHSGGGIGFSRSSPEDRRLLVAFLLHCADLHNPLLPPAMSRRIACELSREFSSQAELERAADLPVTVMLADDDVAKAKMEAGFLDFVVRPLYAALADVAPALGAKCLALIDANRAMWAEIAAGTSVM